MELAGLLSLPVEILHNISQYLNVKDVVNCSETCHYLRMAFNDNTVWRKFVPEKVIKLEAQEQILEPAFHWEDTLTPLCEYRVRYLRLNYLLNNWNTANVVKYTSKTIHAYASGVFNIPKGNGQVFYKDRYLFLGRFINDIESDGIEVWDVDKEPVLHSFLGIKNVSYDRFYVVGSNLVVVECKKVCVYQINLPERHFPLLYSFIITQTEAVWSDEDLHPERCDFCCVGWSNYNIGQYLVSNKCGDEEGEGVILHVWDIFNATKVGAFAPSTDGWSLNVVSSEEDKWLLKVGLQRCNGYSLYHLFNIKEKSFSETGLRIEGYQNPMMLHKSHILAFTHVSNQNSEDLNDCTTCVVYDLKTAAELKKRKFIISKKNCLYSSIAIVNDSFILHCPDGFLKVDALTLETIEHFQCEFNISFITTHQFNIFGSTFLVASGRDRRLNLWNVTGKEKFPRPLAVVYGSHLHLNDTLTKLVLLDYYEINVLHFW